MTRQSAQLEHEAEVARERLSQALNEFRSRMTPGAVVDQLVDYAREGRGAEFVEKLSRDVRENPLPVALLGASLAWLLAASWSRRPNSVDCAHKSPPAVGLPESKQSTSGFTGNTVADSVASLGCDSSAAGGGFMDFAREQPLLVAGLGLVIGAALGAAMVSGGLEGRAIGDSGDRPAKETPETFAARPPPAPEKTSAPPPGFVPETVDGGRKEDSEREPANSVEAGTGRHQPLE